MSTEMSILPASTLSHRFDHRNRPHDGRKPSHGISTAVPGKYNAKLLHRFTECRHGDRRERWCASRDCHACSTVCTWRCAISSSSIYGETSNPGGCGTRMVSEQSRRMGAELCRKIEKPARDGASRASGAASYCRYFAPRCARSHQENRGARRQGNCQTNFAHRKCCFPIWRCHGPMRSGPNCCP